jgi:HlyD family secretion protein
MEEELKSLRIDKSRGREGGGMGRIVGWVAAVAALVLLLGAGWSYYQRATAPAEVEVVRVPPAQAGSEAQAGAVVLNANGYIMAAHKIQVASKVVGKVAWIGVEKGDRVKEGQIIVRLEDDEYRAQLQQARGQLAQLQARLDEALNGSRPEEIAAARANVEQAQADLENARVTLQRTETLYRDKVFAKASYDDALARQNSAQARVNSLQKAFELAKLGPRKEQIDAARGQVEQAKGVVAYMESQLSNTVIRAPVTGTILERAVERGEFVTTSFVGDRGAKGYVVSLADLNDLVVELDISQNDFNKLGPRQRGAITVDAYPNARWQGAINEIAPEANRQKATVQVKVKIETPDARLRPEMNASVAFLSEPRSGSGGEVAARPVVLVPEAAVRDGKVLVLVGDHVVERSVRTSGSTPQGLRVEEGLSGGEDLVVNPPAGLKAGDKARRKGN